MDEGTEDEGVEEPAEEEDHHDLVLATARRIIASDAAIIHRLGTV